MMNQKFIDDQIEVQKELHAQVKKLQANLDATKKANAYLRECHSNWSADAIRWKNKCEALQAEVDRLKSTALPTELTPVIKSVLGMMCFQIGHYAHVYQAAGFDIPKKAEEEQAFCLHRWLGFALEHGDKWTDIANQELKDLREKIAKEQNHD